MSKYAIAGRELMKGNIGNAITAIASKSVNSELIYPSRYRNGNFFFGINGADKAFVWGNYNSSLVAYQKCPVVSAIINKKAQALVNGKRYVMTGTGKKAKEATGPVADAVRKLLKRPNPLQTGREFRAQGAIYKQIYGWNAILKVIPSGYESDYSRWKLWNIPPWMIQVQDTQEAFYLSTTKPFASIRLTYMGSSVVIDQSVITFIKENQISTSTYNAAGNNENSSLFLPDSKLYNCDQNISNFVDSTGSRGSMTRDRGPQWLLTNDSNDGDGGLFPVDPAEVERVQADFLQYGIRAGQRKAIITDAKLKLQTVGFDAGQLKLLEGELQDAKIISDTLNYPPYLLGLVDAKFDNQDVAERALYTNSIIPDCDSEDEQWDDMLGLDSFGLRLETDFSHLPALQEDDVKRSTARLLLDQALSIEYQAGIITMNQWLVALGEDPIGPLGDVRATDVKNTTAPLASIIGVGGVQSLIGVLTASGLSEEARANTLTILFGISDANAAAMVVNSTTSTQTTTNDPTAN
jgi:phage portal protein BeeE